MNDFGVECAENCKFCQVISGEYDYSFIKKMTRGVLLANYSQTYYGRCFYIYEKHISDITEIEDIPLMEVEKEIKTVSKIIKKLFAADLINIASLGNHVQHLHWHIIPRYANDPNWGNPPWPHDKDILSKEEILHLTKKIEKAIDENNN